MNLLKIIEQNFKIMQHNLQMTSLWLNNVNLTMHQTRELYNQGVEFQKKQIKMLQKYAKTSGSDPSLLGAFQEYLIDYAQRRIIFWDVLRKRGNQYIEYIEAGSPPVLVFNYDTIVDGRTLEHPVNYALVKITPPADVVIDDTKRPYLIIDPRAGHGSGIGGFKDDSQVGVAMRAGHPVYFVIFFPNPEPHQTLRDIAVAEKVFADTVKELHPHSPKPCIIGNCQAGWAVMMLAAAVPDLAGGLVINGAPLSYWEGENGKNPMRYLGGLTGGSWIAQLMSDLGNGKFDGANLVMNYERLNPANTYWTKYYHLFANIDDEEGRFLAFERWWGGFYLMNADEIRSIVENLFIGNYLSHGKIPIDRSSNLDLRKIHSPIIIFCSEGDNITSPQQALTWITDIYDNEVQIKEAEQTIIYLVHETIGHLGIFVSGTVATKEHKHIVDVLEYVEMLPPGLYEMIIKDVPKNKQQTHYNVVFEERTIQDIVDRYAIAHHNNKDVFRTVRLVSRYNAMAYDMFLGPAVKVFSSEASAELLRQLNPLRSNRYSISDFNPLFAGLAALAENVRANRKPASADNPFIKLQDDFSSLVEKSLDNYRDYRDNRSELAFYSIYDFLAIIFADTLKRERKRGEVKFIEVPKQIAQNVDAAMVQGDRIDAIIRIILLVVKAQGFLHGSRVGNVREMLQKSLGLEKEKRGEMSQRIRTQTYLVAHDPEKAAITLLKLVPTAEDRKFVIGVLQKLAASMPLLSDKAKETWEFIQKLLSAGAE